jgi:hypothetical protein
MLRRASHWKATIHVYSGQGEPTPSLPCGKNPEIGNLSIFRILTSNLVLKVFY